MNYRCDYRPNSELHRFAVEGIRNEERAAQWRARYTLATGHEPVHMLQPVLTPRQAARIAVNRAGNLNRQPILRYRHQRPNT